MNSWSKSAWEELTLSFDMSWSLATGDSIDTAEVVIYDASGDDVSADMLDGVATISGKFVYQKIIAGEPGQTYTAILQLLTDAEEKFESSVTVSIDPANPPESPTGNYITEAEATAYILANKLNRNSWTTAPIGDRNIALTMATRAIDRLAYIGEKVDPDQTNEFPRGTQTSVPQDIEDACAELAFAFIDGRDAEMEFDNLALSASNFGSVSTTSNRRTYRAHIAAGIPSFEAWVLLLPYMRPQNTFDVVRVN